MNMFFDTEFTGLHKNTTLISLGVVADNGSVFYAEFNDYDATQCDDWIKKNVLSKLLFEKKYKNTVDKYYFSNKNTIEGSSNTVFMYGSKEQISEKFKEWLACFDHVQFFADVCHYDFVLLIDLLGKTAFDLPKTVCPSCHDINQDIANFYYHSQPEIKDPEKRAFDMSRENIAEDFNYIGNFKKHNALSDAALVKSIYTGIKNNMRRYM